MIADLIAHDRDLLLIAAAVWTLPWKGWALWRASRRGEKAWFVALLVVNTLGILEIIYLGLFSRKPLVASAAPGAKAPRSAPSSTAAAMPAATAPPAAPSRPPRIQQPPSGAGVAATKNEKQP